MNEPALSSRPERLASLDVFRGMTMAGMLLGSLTPQLIRDARHEAFARR